MVFRIQHLPHQHVLFADHISRDHRGNSAACVPRAGRKRARLLRSAGDFLPESLLLQNRHTEGRQAISSIAIRNMVRLAQPGGIYRHVGYPDHATPVRNLFVLTSDASIGNAGKVSHVALERR